MYGNMKKKRQSCYFVYKLPLGRTRARSDTIPRLSFRCVRVKDDAQFLI